MVFVGIDNNVVGRHHGNRWGFAFAQHSSSNCNVYCRFRSRDVWNTIRRTFMNTIEQRYAFLISQLKTTNLDLWEGDGILEMKPLFFQFAEAEFDNVADIEFVIDKAIEAKEWDIAHWVIKIGQ